MVWFFVEILGVSTSGSAIRDNKSFQAHSRAKQDFPHNYPFVPGFSVGQLFTKGGVGDDVIIARIGKRDGLPGILQILTCRRSNFAQTEC